MTLTSTTRFLRRSIAVAILATAVAVPAAQARITASGPDGAYPDGWRQAISPVRPDDRADRTITAAAKTYVYADGVLRRTDGTPLSSPVVQADSRFRYADGVLRRTDGTPLSSPIVQADPRFRNVNGVVRAIDGTPVSALVGDGRYVYADGVLRRVDGTPLSSAIDPGKLVKSPAPTFDWRDASVGGLTGFAAALLLAGALVLGRSKGGARVAHP